MLPSFIRTSLRVDRLAKLASAGIWKRSAPAAALCAGLVVLNAALAVFVVSPAAARRDGVRSAYSDLKRQHVDALQFQKQRAALTGLVAGIPSQQDVPILIKDIVQAARRRDLSVGAINSDIPSPGSEGMSMLAFTVPVAGSYPDLKRFIYDMETTDRLIGIQDITLRSEKGRVQLQMKLVTYVKGE